MDSLKGEWKTEREREGVFMKTEKREKIRR